MKKNWLITGGCGFIGTSLIQELIKSKSEVNIRVLDDFSVGTKQDLQEISDFSEIEIPFSSPNGLELYRGDIKNYEDCLNASIGCDCIVHLAANTGVRQSVENPRIDMETNVIGTFNMLESAKYNGVEKFIFASSGAPIGELLTPPIHEELPARPVSPYGASKLAGEGYCFAYHKSFNIKTIILRFGNVYGPRSKYKSSIIAKFLKLALEGQPCEIYGDGTQTRDFIYIADLVDAIIKASQVDLGGELFQIATSRETNINELIEIMKQELAKVDKTMDVIHGEKKAGDVMRNFSDTSKAENILGWKAKTELATGIKNTISYFKQI